LGLLDLTAEERARVLAAFSEELDRCPLCGSGSLEPYGGREHFGIPIFYWICTGCGMVCQGPRLAKAFLPEFYGTIYRKLHDGDERTTPEAIDLQERRGRRLLKLLADHRPSASFESVLDVGCSAGGLLQVARREFGARRLAGVELDLAYSEHARALGFDVVRSVEDYSTAGVSFDVITISHVLEHLYEPMEMIRQVARMLRPEGSLLVEVPHCCEGACFQLTHLWGFHEASLTSLLRIVGLDAEVMVTHDDPRGLGRPNYCLLALARRPAGVPRGPVMRRTTAREQRRRRFMQSRGSCSRVHYEWYCLKQTVKRILGTRDPYQSHVLWPRRKVDR
jgi:SAM-dependent methyltransferase